uniref:ATP-grasp domain-containing protein n=1 Tax=Magnetococcus massalia (strain MO-1) TaxID=451514 RepID=A0A1S7LFD6_MAGMO|nr:protein of unknown function [Candidatus Magnetococcus massalia]
MLDILIISHARSTIAANSPFFIRYLMEYWQAAGYKIAVQQGLQTPPQTQLAINHIKDTYTPEAYQKLFNRFPYTMNGGLNDISKQAISHDGLSRESDHNSTVMVKSRLNGGGRWEAKLTAVREGLPPVVPGQGENYHVYSALSQVPEAIWQSQTAFVQPFYREESAHGYVLRCCYVVGQRRLHTIAFADHPIIYWHNCSAPTVVEDPVKNFFASYCQQVGLEVGAIEYLLVDGEPKVLDVNRTPALPASMVESYSDQLRWLSAGIDRYLEQAESVNKNLAILT